MKIKKSQVGVGLVEVLVALLLLSIAVLGFVALQVRSVVASEEAGHNVQAMILARDLSERMRMNRGGLAAYQPGTAIACGSEFCSPNQLAIYDYEQVKARAEESGMSMSVLDCQGTNTTFKRKCVYVAWGDTVPFDASNKPTDTDGSACTNGTSYLTGAQCVIVEVYNYES